MSANTEDFANMPPEQYEYFTGRSPSGNQSDANPQQFAYATGSFSCPHEPKRTAQRQRTSPNRSSTPGSATQPPSASVRNDIFDKYKQYFASGGTPLSQSLNRSERSASRLSDVGMQQPSANRSNTGLDTLSRPQLSRPQQPPKQQPPVQPAASAARGGYAQPPQEPQKPTNLSVRSNASSTRQTPVIAAVAPAKLPGSQLTQPQQPRPAHIPRSVENPIMQPPPKQQQDPEFYFGPGGERASTSTRASEPQVVSVQPYDSLTDRAYPGEEEIAPEPVMQPAAPNVYQTQPKPNALHEIPESSTGDIGGNDDEFSDPSDNESYHESYNGSNAYQQPQAMHATANEPPRRPSYSRMSRSTASVDTVSSVPRNQQPHAQDYAASNADNNSVDANEDYSFKPQINRRSRNLAARRPEYGQEASDRLYEDADFVRKGTAKKNKYQDLDDGSDFVMPPQQRAQQQAGDGEAVFSRLYMDAKRFNEERQRRERELERQRALDRGEKIVDDDAPEGSQETAHPHRASGGEGNEDGEGSEIRQATPPPKRQIDPEIFERLSKPTYVGKKFWQIKEEEEREQEEAAKKAEDARTAEMEKFAAYNWEVPATSFKFADLQRQNALFVS